MSGEAPPVDVREIRRRVEHLLGIGEPLLACETADEGLQHRPRDVRLRALRCLALARSGATARANRELRALVDEGPADGETYGLLARTHKDLAALAASPETRRDELGLALDAYQRGYDAARRLGNTRDAYFTGINAATLCLLTDAPERAADLAREVRAICREALDGPGADDPWLHATLGEAALLLGEHANAEQHYALAAKRAGGRFADRSTMRRQARLILRAQNEDRARLDSILAVPPIVAFCGHMIDAPDRASPRFPPALEERVARSIREALERIGPAAGFASAACGSDILFLEALLDRGCDFHVTLPFPREEFLETSVDRAPGSDWRSRFDRVLAAAASVTTASDHRASGSNSTYGYANLILTGMAALQARRLESRLVGLTVWDGEAGLEGGTGSAVRLWQSQDLPIDRIDPGAPSRVGSAPPAPAPRKPERTAPHELMAMLFADAVGYSALSEDQIPLFVEHVLRPIADRIEESAEPPVLKETAGDGFYFVFRHVRDAARLALAMRDAVTGVDWPARGLPAQMGLRIALHFGPVHRILDPITGLQKYTGPHTSRTARIEPITPPGHVYASPAFAATAAATGVDDLLFEYVGRTALAKSAGTLGLYHVRRSRPSR